MAKISNAYLIRLLGGRDVAACGMLSLSHPNFHHLFRLVTSVPIVLHAFLWLDSGERVLATDRLIEVVSCHRNNGSRNQEADHNDGGIAAIFFSFFS